jgi:hypothetical protein
MASRAEVEAALSGLSVTGLGPAQARLVSSVRAIADVASLTDTRAGLAAQMLMDYQQVGWSPAFAEHMQRTPYEVLSADICNACAVSVDGAAKIIIWRGILRAIAYFEEWLYITVPAVEILEARGFDDKAVHRTAYGALMPLVHHLRHGLPLPRAGRALGVHDKAGVFRNVAWSAQFLLMHEVGHIAREHLIRTASGALAAPPTLVVPEEINAIKQQEFEADDFVFESLKPDWVATSLLYAFNFLLLLALLERHSEVADTHPLAVNRMRRAIDVLGAQCAPSVVTNIQAVMQFYEELWATEEEAAARMSPAYGEEMLTLVQRAYRLALITGKLKPEGERDAACAKQWDQIIEAFWP